MKSAYFEKFGIANLEVKNLEEPKPDKDHILIRVEYATVNPIDYFTVEGRRKVHPLPHIPGVEIFGSVAEGEDKGRKVVVYPRLFCGSCYLCVSGKEMLCSGELFGVSSNGGFSELALVPKKNVFFIEESISEEVASSLGVGALTAYHAMKSVEPGENVAIFGATGHTGMFLIQFAKMRSCYVFAVTRKKSRWLKDFGADEILSPEEAYEKLKGKCTTVIDPLGSQTFSLSFPLVSKGGKFITFGILTGDKVEISLFTTYSNEISIFGVTGGTRKELFEVIKLAPRLKVRVWKEFKLEKIKEAFSELMKPEREGKILLKV
jgi:D-arabinose 1-dehydrogenase-like Zn-dependent alcohol dehydrogenase